LASEIQLETPRAFRIGQLRLGNGVALDAVQRDEGLAAGLGLASGKSESTGRGGERSDPSEEEKQGKDGDEEFFHVEGSEVIMPFSRGFGDAFLVIFRAAEARDAMSAT
jgi:hypothetical protein